MKIADDLGRIQSSYLRKFGSDADTEAAILRNAGGLYAASMADNLRALNSLPADSASRLTILRQVEGDLVVKADVAGALALSPDAFARTVDVVVRVQAAAGQSLPPNLNVLANSSLHGTQQPRPILLPLPAATIGCSFTGTHVRLGCSFWKRAGATSVCCRPQWGKPKTFRSRCPEDSAHAHFEDRRPLEYPLSSRARLSAPASADS